MHGWLDNFAYRTSISWWVFGLAVGIMILISLITGGWNTYKAARKNPVEVLKYE
jgi:putative ABC transport system permease protein